MVMATVMAMDMDMDIVTQIIRIQLKKE